MRRFRHQLIAIVLVAISVPLVVAATMRYSARQNAERCLEEIVGLLNAGETPPWPSIAVAWQKNSVEDFLASGRRIRWTSPPDLAADFAQSLTYRFMTEDHIPLAIAIVREEGDYRLLSILEETEAKQE